MLETFKPRLIDPFNPNLNTVQSKTLDVSPEQLDYIQKILAKACSDTQFADKAFKAIVLVLSGKSFPPPLVSSLNPNTILLGSPSFDIVVHGTGFDVDSKIVFNGFIEPTTFISPTEVSTGVNMDVWLAPAVVPVGVMDKRGNLSNTQNFTFGAQRSSVTLGRNIVDKIKDPILVGGKDPIKEEKKLSDQIKADIQKKIQPPPILPGLIHSDHPEKK